MAISVADNFSYKGAKPLDARTRYSTVADMKNTAESDLYDGCLAYVTATKKNYQYDSSNTTDPTTGKWRELQTGGGGGASSFADLSDVSISNVSNGQVPKWNSETEKWENANESGGGASSLSDLTDTAISSPVNGQALRYNSTSGKWENQSDEGGEIAIDMSTLTVYKQQNASVTPTSTSNTITANVGSYFGMTYYITAPIDVTSLESLTFELETGTKRSGTTYTLNIGLLSTPPSAVDNRAYEDIGFTVGKKIENANTDYGLQTLDTSNLTGEYYFCVCASTWNATIENLTSHLMGATLSTLGDVSLSNLSDGQGIKWNATSGKWENADIGGGSGGGAWTDVTDTLTASSTSITLSDASITTDSLFDFYTSVFGLSPKSASVSTGSITLTFDAQQSDVTVTVRVYDPNSSGGGGEGGHIIEDNGIEMTQRDTLNFVDFDLEDDDTNEKTVVQSHELTQEEFEEIFSSGLPGAITGLDYSNTSCEANIHSTDERIIGQWIDGKPLYQKTFILESVLSVSYNSFTDTNISATTVEQIVCAYGYDANGTTAELIAHTYGKGSRYTTFALQTTRNSNSISINKFRVQYTKTTDSAVASGEKIVGQWIDGKPIFEKVVDSVAVSPFAKDTFTTLATLDSSLNVDTVVYAYLLATSSGCLNPKSFVGLQYNKTSNTIEGIHTRTVSGSGYILNAGKIILRYTKS